MMLIFKGGHFISLYVYFVYSNVLEKHSSLLITLDDFKTERIFKQLITTVYMDL